MKRSKTERNDLADTLRNGKEDNKKRSTKSKAKDCCNSVSDMTTERNNDDARMGYVNTDSKAKDCCKTCSKKKDDASGVSDCSNSGKKRTKSSSNLSDCNMRNSSEDNKKRNDVSDCNSKTHSGTSEKRRSGSAR